MRKSEMLEPSPVLLCKGQALFAQLKRGTVLRTLSGEMVLLQHTALEQDFVMVPTLLPRGAVHCVESTAWVELRAQADAQVLILAPAALCATPLLHPWMIRLQAWIAAMGKSVGLARV